MRIARYLNPFFVYRRRHLIGPHLRNFARDAAAGVDTRAQGARVLLAEHGLSLSQNDRQLARLRDLHAGRRAFVIGNGPSLKISDLEKLSSEITFASNRIYVAFGETAWRPVYYASYYPDDLVQHQEALRKMDSTCKFFPIAAKALRTDLPNMLYYRNVHRWFFPECPAFSDNAIRQLFWGGTITYILLQLAFWMGVSEVYLLGIDHEFQLSSSEEATTYKHYTMSGNDKDHFMPNYYQPGEKIYGAPSMREYDLAYESARMAFEGAGRRVVNATRGGKLEVFPRENIDDVLAWKEGEQS